ncbi:sensor histidine kinase [Microbacterium sp. ASV49]|uniref:histidine kinase n=1 Tax=Microbacterium candidum TaxID=3041922 RepID=A0ABT7MVK0_9MICO|nr:HAMP domain-containing sensor histidine kinase [Microbacterium sp. ASV49]MDL9978450.1 HAMP domain-containing sensor histidine kinase [Microbacterium sp. ASV49]
MSDSPDERRVRRSAGQIALWTGIASAVVLAVGVGILVAVILLTARPEGGPDPDDPRGTNPDHIVVDVDRVLPWVVLLGIVGVVLLGLVAWLAARQAVRPLGEALRVQRNFLADASHELRTPLTALTSRVQILQRRHARGEPIDDTIQRLRRDASAMDDILTELLLAAQDDHAPASAEPADVHAAIAAAVDTVRPIADEAGVALEHAAAGAPHVAVPAVTLTRLCVALLDNAVQHSPAGATVVVTAERDGRSVEIRVADQGPGVAAEDRDRVFERFARGADTGRRRGFGLGLALVRDVANRYDGTVAIDSTSAEGTTFLLSLPAAR